MEEKIYSFKIYVYIWTCDWHIYKLQIASTNETLQNLEFNFPPDEPFSYLLRFSSIVLHFIYIFPALSIMTSRSVVYKQATSINSTINWSYRALSVRGVCDNLSFFFDSLWNHLFGEFSSVSRTRYRDWLLWCPPNVWIVALLSQKHPSNLPGPPCRESGKNAILQIKCISLATLVHVNEDALI